MSREMLKIEADRGFISLRGELHGGGLDESTLRAGLRSAHASVVKVDASAMRLAPAGVELWIKLVHELLVPCKIVYRSSQLADVLFYDDHYAAIHKESTFEGVQD